MQPPPEAKTEPKQVPEPPVLVDKDVDVSEQTGMHQTQLPGPPRPPRRNRPPQQPVETVASAPEQPAPAAPVPQLAQILTSEQQNSYNVAVDRNLERAQKTVNVLSQRKLNHDQAVYLERINGFIQQAGEARRTDLVRAANLAERAAVLADDLLRTLR